MLVFRVGASVNLDSCFAGPSQSGWHTPKVRTSKVPYMPMGPAESRILASQHRQSALEQSARLWKANAKQVLFASFAHTDECWICIKRVEEKWLHSLNPAQNDLPRAISCCKQGRQHS